MSVGTEEFSFKNLVENRLCDHASQSNVLCEIGYQLVSVYMLACLKNWYARL